jgi:hypothetical protein
LGVLKFLLRRGSKLVYEGFEEKATYNASDSGDWDRTTGLAERDASSRPVQLVGMPEDVRIFSS